MLCESTTRRGSLSLGGAWRRSHSPRNENSRLTKSNRLARKTRSRARCISGTAASRRSKLRVEARDWSWSSRLREAFPHGRSGDQHDIAAVSLHGRPALLGIELVVDLHYRCQVVALRQLGH